MLFKCGGNLLFDIIINLVISCLVFVYFVDIHSRLILLLEMHINFKSLAVRYKTFFL